MIKLTYATPPETDYDEDQRLRVTTAGKKEWLDSNPDHVRETILSLMDDYEDYDLEVTIRLKESKHG